MTPQLWSGSGGGRARSPGVAQRPTGARCCCAGKPHALSTERAPARSARRKDRRIAAARPFPLRNENTEAAAGAISLHRASPPQEAQDPHQRRTSGLSGGNASSIRPLVSHRADMLSHGMDIAHLPLQRTAPIVGTAAARCVDKFNRSGSTAGGICCR